MSRGPQSRATKLQSLAGRSRGGGGGRERECGRAGADAANVRSAGRQAVQVVGRRQRALRSLPPALHPLAVSTSPRLSCLTPHVPRLSLLKPLSFLVVVLFFVTRRKSFPRRIDAGRDEFDGTAPGILAEGPQRRQLAVLASVFAPTATVWQACPCCAHRARARPIPPCPSLSTRPPPHSLCP